ncbi:MAG TPA: P1 family peptidase [Candidatus Bathyarchaeia archaeon]|nr:P1 family peptidase [Candidatus Bathyarchaeia archaeon]
MANSTLTAVEGVKVGHAQNELARTGCTVILFEPEADVACDARGGWPGTYDTHSIDIGKTYVKKHAIFLTGGDVFGFDSAIGVRRFLLEQKMAMPSGAGKIPGIVGANIWDLDFASIHEADYSQLGCLAGVNASSNPAAEGNVGAGMGATVGKLKGLSFACKGGCGTYAVRLPNDIVVGALIITNSVGNVYDIDADAKTIVGTRTPGGGFLEFDDLIPDYMHEEIPRSKTTIGVVATNVDLSHENVIRLAQMANDGLAMSIRPIHMSRDGDTLFAASTARIGGMRESKRMVDLLGYTATRCVVRAVVRSVKAAQSLSNIPSWDELTRRPANNS